MRNEPERKDILSVRKPVRRTHLGNRVPKSSSHHPVFASNRIYKPGFPSPRLLAFDVGDACVQTAFNPLGVEEMVWRGRGQRGGFGVGPSLLRHTLGHKN